MKIRRRLIGRRYGMDRRRVFLVVGRWQEAREAMGAFLRSLGLVVVEWEDALLAAGEAGRYPMEILNAGLARCYAVVVLMTPDDLSVLHPELRLSPTDEAVLRAQPRPNVVFEAGMAYGWSRSRTLTVVFGNLRVLSDLNGVDRVRFDGSAEARRAVVTRLKAMRVKVNDAGAGWLTAGRFPLPLRAVTAAELGLMG